MNENDTILVDSANYVFSHKEAVAWLDRMRASDKGLAHITGYQMAALIHFINENGLPGSRPFEWRPAGIEGPGHGG